MSTKTRALQFLNCSLYWILKVIEMTDIQEALNKELENIKASG